MLKEYLWKLFENTGEIDPYVVYKEIENKVPVQKSCSDKIPIASENSLTEKMNAEEEIAISNG